MHWDPKYGAAEVGRLVKTYTKLLTEDTGLQLEDLHNTMDDRILRREGSIWSGQPARFDDDDFKQS